MHPDSVSVSIEFGANYVIYMERQMTEQTDELQQSSKGGFQSQNLIT